MPRAATLSLAKAAPTTKYVGGSMALVKSVKNDETGKKTYTFLATTEAVDRDGEIITLDGWDFAAFEANPVILDGHDYYSGCKAVVGRGVAPLRRTEKGWEIDVEFAPTDEGKRVEMLVDGGFIKAVSVGFIPKKIERVKGEPPKHTEKELLEISVVPIPSNRDARRVAGFAQTLAVGPADNIRYLTPSDFPERPTPTKAIDFDQAMANAELSDRKWEMYHALHEALDSIREDKEMDYDAKMAMGEQTCGQFHGAMMQVFTAALGPKPETPVQTEATPTGDTKAGAKLSQSSKTEMEAACGEMKQAMDCMMGARDRLMKMMAPADDHSEEQAEETEGKAATVEETPAAEPETPATQEVLEPEAKNLDGLATAVSAFAALLKKE